MLQLMREQVRYLKWVLILVIVPFIYWGAGSLDIGRAPGAEGDWAAEVNGETIPAGELRDRARAIDGEAQAGLGNQYAQMKQYLRIGQRALGELVDSELLYQEAVRQNLQVSPREIARFITRHPQFQENGRFIGARRYRELFRGGRASIEAFESDIHRRLMIAKCSSLITDGARVSDDEIEAEFRRRNETTTVDYFVAEAEKLLAGNLPAAEEVEGFYRENTGRYMKGEGRVGTYALLDARDLGAAAGVGDDEVEAAYERDKVNRYIVPDQRRASHILFRVAQDAPAAEVASVEKKAREVLGKIRAGGDFEALAREHSDDGSASNGGDLDYFGRGQMVPPFEEAAFSLQPGEVSDLVRTGFGFHIIKVTDVRQARTVPFDEVRDAIRDELARSRGRQLATERAGALAKAAADGDLETVARSQGLPLSDTGAMRSGDALPAVPGSQGVVARMLAMNPGQVSDPIAVPAGQVIVKVTAVVADEPRPFEEVREQVRNDLLNERALRRLDGAIDGARKTGGDLRRAAKSLGQELKTAENLSRGGQLAGVAHTPEVTREIERLGPGEIGAPVVTPSGLVVVSVRERTKHSERLPDQRAAIHEALLSERQNRLLQSFLRQLRSSGSVIVNEPLVQALDRG
jgi:peptidyl-prolyl cis-trans isomerase D